MALWALGRMTPRTYFLASKKRFAGPQLGLIYAILLAAGRGTRFGADKTTAHLGGKPLWQWSYETLSSHQSVSGVVCVHGEENFADMPNAVPGGSSRSTVSPNRHSHTAHSQPDG